MKDKITNRVAVIAISAMTLSFLLVGCDHEVYKSETSTTNSDGTVKTKEKTVTESKDGTVTTKEETKKTPPAEKP